MKRIVQFSLLSLTLLMMLANIGCSNKLAIQNNPANQQSTTMPSTNVTQPPISTQQTVIPPQTQAMKPGDFFPATVGASWDYAGSGNEYAPFKRKALYVSGNLIQLNEDNGGTATASVYKITDDAVTRVYFTAEEYTNSNHLSSPQNDSWVILKAPLTVGAKWNDKRADREIIDMNATAITTKGTFKQCLKLKIIYPESQTIEYYKQGVGLVLREFGSGENKVTSSLKAYDIP